MTKIPKDVIRELGPGEEVELYIEKKIYHPKINVDSMALTNQRIILRHPQREKMQKSTSDLSYSDLGNPSVKSGPLRSTITFQLRSEGKQVILDKLSNAEAEKAVGVIRANIARYQTPFSTGPSPVIPGGMAPAQPMGIRCHKCGRIGRLDSKYCDACGSKLN